MTIRIGPLRHRVNILRPDTTKGSYGSDVISWSTDKTVWAAIWPLKGSEYFQAQEIKSSVTHKIRIRYATLNETTAINAKCRFEKIDDERQFEIISPPINFEDRNIYLDIMCAEAT